MKKIAKLAILIFVWYICSLSFIQAKVTPPPKVKNIPCRRLIEPLKYMRTAKQKQIYLEILKRQFSECLVFAQLNETISSPTSNTLISWADQSLLSNEIIKTFPRTNIEQANTQASTQEGKVIKMQLLDDPKIFNSWMESQYLIQTEKSSQKYLVVFHLENGKWKIFGTEKIE